MSGPWDEFRSVSAADLLEHLGTGAHGLTTAEATQRLRRFGTNARTLVIARRRALRV